MLKFYKKLGQLLAELALTEATVVVVVVDVVVVVVVVVVVEAAVFDSAPEQVFGQTATFPSMCSPPDVTSVAHQAWLLSIPVMETSAHLLYTIPYNNKIRPNALLG